MEKLTEYEMDCSHEPDGYYLKRVPKATERNIVVLMDKLNEAIEKINNLEQRITWNTGDLK